ncbi:MAG TPA: YceI family protein [Bacteroidia bacterium]|nr:YceI family protein [Bacteroidia bacterium]
MRKIKLFICVCLVFLSSAFVWYRSNNWTVKNDYILKFRFGKYSFGVDSMPAPNYGTIKGLKASIIFDQEHPEQSKIFATVEAKTIDTGNSSKNASATGPDVLISDQFPLLSFESSTITKSNSGYVANGKLTIKNITRDIQFPFVFANNTFEGGFTIESKDFHFTHPHVPEYISVFFILPVNR